ncbi:hypothetical protein OIV83_006052 [Microbotryomycetes sp. JL201]|nr:hypothetical protein OIV83_006052 [Microbotryomycetes sp. JL201]
MHSGRATVDALEAAIRDSFGAKAFKHAHELAIDCLAVVWGVRSATLIDTIYIDLIEARRLSRALQLLLDEPDLNVSFVYDSRTSTAFVVNLDVLRGKLSEPDPVFVQLGGLEPELLTDRPTFLTPLLERIAKPTRADLIELDINEREIHHLVTLSGYLLDYSCAYVLSAKEPQNMTCLDKKNLVLVTAQWSFDGPETGERDLLSFSYPAQAAEMTSGLHGRTQPEVVCNALHRRLTSRAIEAAKNKARIVNIKVSYKVIQLDRVAL